MLRYINNRHYECIYSTRRNICITQIRAAEHKIILLTCHESLRYRLHGFGNSEKCKCEGDIEQSARTQ